MTALAADDDAIKVIDVDNMCCAVCAPIGMQREVIELRVNAQNPTGIPRPWRIAPDIVVDGETVSLTQPADCESDNQRQHWLLRC